MLLSHPVFLLGIQLRHLLLQSFAGTLNILRGPTDTHKVTVLRWRRDGDVDIVFLHHLAHVLALAANDEAVVVKGHRNLFCYGHQFLRGGRENGYMFTLWKQVMHLVRIKKEKKEAENICPANVNKGFCAKLQSPTSFLTSFQSYHLVVLC